MSSNISPETVTKAPLKSPKSLKEPLSTRVLSTREKITLLESSKLHGSIFPPWKSAPDALEFSNSGAVSPFIDDTVFSMSPLQTQVLSGWQSIDDTLSLLNSKQDAKTGTDRVRLDLVQDITADCSVIASLCAITSRTERGHSDILSSIVHPYDYAEQKPAKSANGKYVLRLKFNGCYRKVIIDDRLPKSKTLRMLHVVSRGSPNVLWPALVEKAYLKVRGGYDFPGSNSGTDIWVLTGWLPEQLFLQSDDIDRCALWRRLSKSFNYGDVLITLGTGKLTQDEERSIGLIGEHDYAVIDMKDLRGQRLLLVKNPWSEGTVWKGHARYDEEIKAFADLKLRDAQECVKPESEGLAPGIFWIGLQDVFQSFESIYLNWNPGLFSYREDIHFQWDLAKLRPPRGTFRCNPQFSVSNTTAGLVWLLLSRHFTSRERSVSSDQEASDSGRFGDHGFISLYAFEKDGQRVLTNNGAVATSPYVDSPNALLKLEIPAHTTYTIAVSEQALVRLKQTFTLSALSLQPINLASARDRYLHHTEQHGAWTDSMAGGNAGSPLYHVNPQFSITLHGASDVSLLLESRPDTLPIHVKLVWASGSRIHQVKTRDVVGDSGEHTKGFALAEIHDVPQGSYTIVCSTFARGETGTFNLYIGSVSTCHVDRLPVVAAGRFVSGVRSVVFPAVSYRLEAPLMGFRMNRLSTNAYSRGNRSAFGNDTRSPLKISLELGQGMSKKILVVSGEDEFIDTSNARARTPEIDIQPNMYRNGELRIVLERLIGTCIPHEELVDLEIVSEEPLEVGSWTAWDRE